MDKQDTSVSVDGSSGASTKPVVEQNRLESLLLDTSDSTHPVDSMNYCDIKDSEKKKKNHFSLLLLLSLLFLSLLLGLGYLFSDNLCSQQPSITQVSYYVSPRIPIPARQNKSLSTEIVTAPKKTHRSDVNIVSPEKNDQVQETSENIPDVSVDNSLFSVKVGPFISDGELQQASTRLQELGFQAQRQPGRGQVTMVRLLEGIYPADEARIHLKSLKKVVASAFLLPDGDNLAVYAGSFQDEKRAQKFRDDLANKWVNVALLDSEVTLDGTMLMVLQADHETAQEVAAYISRLGLHTQVVKKK